VISEPTCGYLSGTLKLVSADPPPPDGGPACPGAPTRDPGNGDAERFSNVLSLADSRRVRSEPVHVDGARVGASNDTFTAGLRGLTAEAHRKVLQLTHTHTHTRTHTHAVCTNFASSFTHTSKRVNRAGCVCVCVCVCVHILLSVSLSLSVPTQPLSPLCREPRDVHASTLWALRLVLPLALCERPLAM
jgi:hypothetical protein